MFLESPLGKRYCLVVPLPPQQVAAFSGYATVTRFDRLVDKFNIPGRKHDITSTLYPGTAVDLARRHREGTEQGNCVLCGHQNVRSRTAAPPSYA
jgi:hypothetical protein